MDDKAGYAVFFFPQAIEALGDAIKPYLAQGAAGEHVVCREIDTAGALIEMTIDGRDAQDRAVELELMVPSSMVRMIVSVRADEVFGFVPRAAALPQALPPLGPTAAPLSPSVPASPVATAAADDGPEG